MNVNLKLMQTFLLVAEYSSFGRAAEMSNRSQSAVSMQIRQLELQLGVSLFNRSTRRVQLTREGELLLVSTRKALSELQTGLRQIQEAGHIQRGRLTLACSPLFAATRLPEILATFQRSRPGVTAQVRELAGSEMLDSIRRQEVDFGIGPRASAHDIQCQPILQDEIQALIPTSMPASQRDSITLLELSRLPTLMLTGRSNLQDLLEKAQKSTGIQLNMKYEVQQVQTQIAMCAAGLGAAILPGIAIPSKPDPRVRAVRIVQPTLALELCVVTLRGHLLSPVAARFVEVLKEMFGPPTAATASVAGATAAAATATAAAPVSPGPGGIGPALITPRRTHLALASSQSA